MASLEHKAALVTGSARGIGRAIAERYAALGANVVVNYSTGEAQARETVAAIERMGATAVAVQANVARVEDVDRLFDAALERFGSLDIVVANAGVELVAHPVLDVSEEDFDRLFSINAKGAFFTLQRGARHVADNGRIIYIGSSSTAFPQAGMGAYSSSKTPGQFLVEVLAKEIGARGVTVNSILPTAIEGAGVFTDGVATRSSSSSAPPGPSSAWEPSMTSPTPPSTSQATSLASSAASICSSAEALLREPGRAPRGRRRRRPSAAPPSTSSAS